MNEIEGIASIVNSEVANKAYDQSLSPAAQEIGKLGGDLAKTARLLLAPLQIAALWQDKFTRILEEMRNRIPENRQIEAPPSITATAFENMKYTEESSPLYEMFKEVLMKSCDKDSIHLIHPSFVHIIKQLTRDEAIILSELQNKAFSITDRMSLNQVSNLFENLVIEKSSIPKEKLDLADSFNLYYSHLESLSLVAWPVNKQDPIVVNGVQTGVRRYSTIQLTDFGKLFVDACIPK